MTASEPLTLEEEFEMQKSWQEDPDKLTFILTSLDFKSPHPEGNIAGYGGMIGDVNLYLMSDDNESDNEYLPAAEIEVMIAEESMRGKRLAGEAVRIMMRFAKERLGIYRFVAKISEKNQQSLKLFTVGLGFTEVSRSKVFQEVTLQHIYKDDTTALHVQFVEEKFDSLKL